MPGISRPIIPPPGATIVYGTQYSQWNIPVTGGKGMCGTFTAIALQVVGSKSLDGDFLDEMTARSAQLHCLSAPKRSHQWNGVADAVETLHLGLDLDYVRPYLDVAALEPVFAALLVGEGLSILMGAYTVAVKKVEEQYIFLDSHALPHSSPRTTAILCSSANGLLSMIGDALEAQLSSVLCGVSDPKDHSQQVEIDDGLDDTKDDSETADVDHLTEQLAREVQAQLNGLRPRQIINKA